MSLKEIVENSNYVTDEELTDSNLLGIAKTCIGEVNRKCDIKLPMFEEIDLTDSEHYTAIPETWVSALVEPYLSYAIMANDGDTNARDFHYNRFLAAVDDFKNNGGIGTITDDGFKGDSVKFKAIDVRDRTMHWEDWF